MRVTLLAVGRLKECYWRDACDEYLKRLRPYAAVRVVELADRDPGKATVERAVQDEGADVLAAVRAGEHVVALDVAGRAVDSVEFSRYLERLALDGRSAVTFVIGGSHGLSADVLSRADERLSLGPMTLPHNLARVVLLEQLYRAFRIARGEPYHK